MKISCYKGKKILILLVLIFVSPIFFVTDAQAKLSWPWQWEKCKLSDLENVGTWTKSCSDFTVHNVRLRHGVVAKRRLGRPSPEKT